MSSIKRRSSSGASAHPLAARYKNHGAITLNYEATTPEFGPQSEERIKRKRKREEADKRHDREHAKRAVKQAKYKEKRESAKAKQNQLRKKTDFLCRMKFHNDLPEVPVEPKFLAYPLSTKRFVPYATTSLDMTYKAVLHSEPDLGISLHLIDRERFAADPDAVLAPEDVELLDEDTGAKEKELSSLAWLRNTEYISTDYSHVHTNRKEVVERLIDSTKGRGDEEEDIDLEEQLKQVEASFTAMAQPPRHQSKPGVKAKKVLPILPNYEQWPNQYLQVHFHEDPYDLLPDEHTPIDDILRTQRMNNAVLKARHSLKGQEFVVQLLPTPPSEGGPTAEALEAASKEKGEVELPYKWVGEYSHDVVGDAGTNLLLAVNDGAGTVRYNKFLPRKITLSKMKIKADDLELPESVSVTVRDITEEEKEDMDKLRGVLRGEEEEEEDDDDVEGGVESENEGENGGSGDGASGRESESRGSKGKESAESGVDADGDVDMSDVDGDYDD